MNDCSANATPPSYLRSPATLSALPLLVARPALTGFLASVSPRSPQITSGGRGSPEESYMFVKKWAGLSKHLQYLPPFCRSHQAPKRRPTSSGAQQSQRRFLFCSQENAASPLPVFSRGFLTCTVCVPGPSRFFFFSKQLWGRETKLKGKHYAFLHTQGPAARTLGGGGGQAFLPTSPP